MQLDPRRAPLYEALERHARRRAAAFHVPGHKQRAAWHDAEDAAERYAALLPLDVTELSDTDDLHHPEGAIAEAERLTADCFGAEESCLLVGGSTAGNLAMILGVCRPGETLLVQRNVHKSIIHGLMLAGARAVLLPPMVDGGSGLAVAPSLETVREALRRDPDAKAVILGNPNYYGVSVRLLETVEAAHAAGVPVLVDEAHGPHFGRHPLFPMSALEAGADIVVQSAHKMLSAMTMGAWLHMQGRLAPRSAVRQQLRMVQSSSPSYPIMASLDLARRELHMRKEQAFEEALVVAREVRQALAEAASDSERGNGSSNGGKSSGNSNGDLSPFGILAAAPFLSANIAALDPLKLVLYDATGTLDGFKLYRELEARRCVAEMADDRYVVLALGTGTRREDGQALLRALAEIAAAYRLAERPRTIRAELQLGGNPATAAAPTSEPIPEPALLSRESPPTEAVELEQAAGRIAGEWVIPYPPGIPVLYPGETVTEETVARLIQWRREGARIQGAADSSLHTLQVAKMPEQR